MATITSKSIEIQRSLESLNLTSKAIQLIKDVIIYGFWGDSDISFNCEMKMSNVYITNDGARGKHFPKKQISGIMSGVAKAIKKYGCSFMTSESDWWGNGSGSVLAFDIDFASDKALAVVGDTKPLRARLKELKGRFNPGLTVEGVRRAGWVFSAKSYTVDTLRQAIFA